MDNSKPWLVSIRAETAQKERKKAIDKMLNDKRAKVITGASDQVDFERLFAERSPTAETCSKLLDSLFSHLETNKGKLDKEVCLIFNKIRNITSAQEVVEPIILHMLTTPKFIALVIDFLRFGNEDQVDIQLYRDTLREVLWICSNISTTPFEEHEKTVIDSGLIGHLLECFLEMTDLDLSVDILLTFINFMAGREIILFHMKELKTGEVFRNKFDSILETRQDTSHFWLSQFSLAITIYISSKSIVDPKEAIQLLPVINVALQATQVIGESWLRMILKFLCLFFEQASRKDLQLIIQTEMSSTLIHLLMQVPDAEEFHIIGCLTQLTRAIDINPFIYALQDAFFQPTGEFRYAFGEILSRHQSSKSYRAFFNLLRIILESNAEAANALANKLVDIEALRHVFQVYTVTNHQTKLYILEFFIKLLLASSPNVVVHYFTEDTSILDLVFDEMKGEGWVDLNFKVLELLKVILHQDSLFARRFAARDPNGSCSVIKDYMSSKPEVQLLEDMQQHACRELGELAHEIVQDYLDYISG